MRSTRRSRGGAGAPPGFFACLRHFLTPAVWKQAQACCPAKRKRRWGVQAVVLVLLAMCWLTHDTAEERFQVACAVAITCRPKRRRPGRTVPGFLKAVHRLPARSLVVMVAGYISAPLMLRLVVAGHAFVLRLNASVQLLTPARTPLERYQQGRVLWWPQEARRRGLPALPARLVRVRGKRGAGDLWLLTSVLE